MPSGKTILVCPLNWGLGHASRDIIIIRHLLNLGHSVVTGGDKKALSLLVSEFPLLPSVRIPDITIRYSRHLPAWLMIMCQLPLILAGSVREHIMLGRILKKLPAEIIISDNRYGLWNKKVTSVMITHQLSPRLPVFLRVLEPFLSWLIRRVCQRFDYCWIPDIPGPVNFSGILPSTSGLSVRIRHVGILSRFSGMIVTGNVQEDTDLLVILSGPEPQRSILLDILISQIHSFPGRSLIVAGEPQKAYDYMINGSCRIVSSLGTEKLISLIHSAKYILCRCGYSSIMDMASLGKSALFIPTPGQTEQEYLSQHLESAGLFPVMKQQGFDLMESIKLLDRYKFRIIELPDGLLDGAIKELVVSG